MSVSKAARGTVRPIVDPARCEGAGDCVRVCPHAVFEIVPMGADVFRALPLTGKIKALVHGRRTAATPRADACAACGLCVHACPERAIVLRRQKEA